MSSPALHRLLVVDDEPDLRTLYELTLLREGYDVETAGTVGDAWQHLQDQTFSAVITDMRLPDGTGLELLQRLEAAGRHEKSIVITAYGSAENAVSALKSGAYDYLTKPVDLKQFRSVVASAMGRSDSLVKRLRRARTGPRSGRRGMWGWLRPPLPPPAARVRSPASLPGGGAMGRMAGQSSAMQQVRGLVAQGGPQHGPGARALGESGTGKELVARAIHEVSARCSQRPLWRSTAVRSPSSCSRPSFLATARAPSPAPTEDRAGFFQAAQRGHPVPR
jgi:two-component system response regulator PilR (NtrC family)